MLIKEQNAKRKSLTALNLYKVVALISINLSIYTVKTMQCSFIFDHFQISFVTYLNINVSRLSWKNFFYCFFFLFHLFYGMTNGIFVSLFTFVSLFMFLLYLMYIKH